MKKRIFERYPKLTLFVIILIAVLAIIIGMEIMAGSLFGLGKPVVYNVNPLYGYRPSANQVVARKRDQEIRINNLGLRAEQDWDPSDFYNKVLFLGDSVTYGGSYIANKQLFSHLAVQNPKWQAGNAGVNGWGVNNVHALVRDKHFLPAQIYVSVFPEGDFYRGFMRIGGQPFWTQKPAFALEELFHHIVYNISLKKMIPPSFSEFPEEDKDIIAEIAVKNLKALDEYLLDNQRFHLIYISPTRGQVLGEEPVDARIKQLLAKHNVHVIYIKDQLTQLSPQEKSELFHDNIHLSVRGHQVWGQIIAQDLDGALETNQPSELV